MPNNVFFGGIEKQATAAVHECTNAILGFGGVVGSNVLDPRNTLDQVHIVFGSEIVTFGSTGSYGTS